MNQKRIELCLQTSQAIFIALLIGSLYWVFSINSTTNYEYDFLTLAHSTLTLSVGADNLSRLMFCVVLLISTMIYFYAKRYLDSDTTRCRFLFQLSLVTASVLLLILSKNLLTAFVGWQLIGLNLYLLLNHYRDDWQANRAAKKKFIINRIGDLCFLSALILCYQNYSSSDFTVLFQQATTAWIPFLLFIAVMTKSAQFPFHIWLPDTLEAPTPVSAIMHAGIINSGGFLLTRIAPMLVEHITVMMLLTLIGIITALIGLVFYHYQPDVKKKLAYSTVGQMGYMVFQCGLGAFPSAVFHLISHGFYKASLFLNSSDTLFEHKKPKKMTAKACLLSIITSLIGVALVYQFLITAHVKIEPILLGFISVSLLSVTQNLFSTQQKIRHLVVQYIVLLMLLIAYAALLKVISSWVGLSLVYSWLSIKLQITLSIILICLFYAFQCPSIRIENTTLIRKGNIEAIYRKALLEPLRSLGDWLYSKTSKWEKWLLVATICVLVLAMLFKTSNFNFYSVGLFSLLAITSSIIANRAQTLRSIFLWLATFELAVAIMMVFAHPSHISPFVSFHIINAVPIFVMLIMISQVGLKSHKTNCKPLTSHKTPWLSIYLTAGLLLMIGIPGTASFVSEIFLFSQLIGQSTLILLLYALAMFMLSIALMHALQTSVFSKASHIHEQSKLPIAFHLICAFAILFNVVNGFLPSYLLRIVGA